LYNKSSKQFGTGIVCAFRLLLLVLVGIQHSRWYAAVYPFVPPCVISVPSIFHFLLFIILGDLDLRAGGDDLFGGLVGVLLEVLVEELGELGDFV
jgi:hypothetical protein